MHLSVIWRDWFWVDVLIPSFLVTELSTSTLARSSIHHDLCKSTESSHHRGLALKNTTIILPINDLSSWMISSPLFVNAGEHRCYHAILSCCDDTTASLASTRWGSIGLYPSLWNGRMRGYGHMDNLTENIYFYLSGATYVNPTNLSTVFPWLHSYITLLLEQTCCLIDPIILFTLMRDLKKQQRPNEPDNKCKS